MTSADLQTIIEIVQTFRDREGGLDALGLQADVTIAALKGLRDRVARLEVESPLFRMRQEVHPELYDRNGQ